MARMNSAQGRAPGHRERRKALIVGGGAREHAIARALVAGGAEVVAAPGNPGIAALGRVIAAPVDDTAAVTELARSLDVDLVVVGPELPLTKGLADALRAASIPVFGPGRAAARLEGSKSFMKDFLTRHRIPTAAYRVFDDPAEALDYVRREARPLVVKADGLAAGKGVVVAGDADEAARAVGDMMVKRVFGDSGARVVVEELLPGEEVSFHVVCSASEGRVASVALAPSQDHKRIFDGDRGPNTGGMGAYAPAPLVDREVEERILLTIVEPTLRGLLEDGLDYRGVLFVGLMIERGIPRVLEFNVRFGDPETTCILPLFGGDLWDLFMATAKGDTERLATMPLAPEHQRAALSVVLAAEGYPASPRIGDAISGLGEDEPDCLVSHAGTRREGEALVTAGGRVLAVTGLGASLKEARDAAYRMADRIDFRGKQLRRDIGFRALR